MAACADAGLLVLTCGRSPRGRPLDPAARRDRRRDRRGGRDLRRDAGDDAASLSEAGRGRRIDLVDWQNDEYIRRVRWPLATSTRSRHEAERQGALGDETDADAESTEHAGRRATRRDDWKAIMAESWRGHHRSCGAPGGGSLDRPTTTCRPWSTGIANTSIDGSTPCSIELLLNLGEVRRGRADQRRPTRRLSLVWTVLVRDAIRDACRSPGGVTNARSAVLGQELHHVVERNRRSPRLHTR